MDPDGDQLTYEIYYVVDTREEKIPTWIEFDKLGLFLKIIPPSNMLFNDVQLKIVATDKLFLVSQFITVSIGLSLTYFF